MGTQPDTGSMRGDDHMNIKEAKEEIIRTIKAYTAVDEDDQPVIPISAQRPLLLMGPPGIGKTAVMEQAAKVCHVGLLSHTITHHTRQSAVGLPELVHRTYDGKEYTVTQYTMSERSLVLSMNIWNGLVIKKEFCLLMRSTVYRRRWRLRSCSSYSLRRLEPIRFLMAGSLQQQEILRNSMHRCGNLTWRRWTGCA